MDFFLCKLEYRPLICASMSLAKLFSKCSRKSWQLLVFQENMKNKIKKKNNKHQAYTSCKLQTPQITMSTITGQNCHTTNQPATESSGLPAACTSLNLSVGKSLKWKETEPSYNIPLKGFT